MLNAEHITVRFGNYTAVEDVSFHLNAGDWLMLAGPNGAGKSTLVNALSQSVPYTGKFLLEGKDIRCLKPAALAREIGVLGQHHRVEYGYTVWGATPMSGAFFPTATATGGKPWNGPWP